MIHDMELDISNHITNDVSDVFGLVQKEEFTAQDMMTSPRGTMGLPHTQKAWPLKVI